MKKNLKSSFLVLAIALTIFTTYSSRNNRNIDILKGYSISYSFKQENFYQIPMLDTSYVPQGICLLKNSNYSYRLITAYDSSNSKNSCIHVISCDGDYIKTLFLEDSVGIHVGGITSDLYGLYIFVCDSKNKCIRIYNSSLVENSPDQSIIKDNCRYETQNIPSFISYDNEENSIWVGSFSLKNEGILVEYSIDFQKKRVISIPIKIQGMAKLSTGEIALSQSYGSNNNSRLLKGVIYGDRFVINSKIVLPPGLEEIYSTENDNIFLLFESASKRYRSRKGISNVVLLKNEKKEVS